jgi:hypothetical protein
MAHDRLEELGELRQLPFGRTCYSINDGVHLMFRFSKAHFRNDEIEYFLGVTPQYFERIRSLGNGFMVFVLGSPKNALLVPAESCTHWVQDVETCGSGTWPMSRYQKLDQRCTERWVLGQGREDVSVFVDDYDSLSRALS